MSWEKRANAIDHSHHLSDYACRYALSPLKGLQKYYGKDLIPFAGGALSIKCLRALLSLTPCRPAQSGVLPLPLHLGRHPSHGRVPAEQRASTNHVVRLRLSLTTRLALASPFRKRRWYDARPGSSRAPRRRRGAQPRHRASIRSRDGPRAHKGVFPRIYGAHICTCICRLGHAHRHGQHRRVRTLFFCLLLYLSEILLVCAALVHCARRSSRSCGRCFWWLIENWLNADGIALLGYCSTLGTRS